MGTKIGTCDIAVRFCHYGTTILTHLPMLDDQLVIKTDKKYNYQVFDLYVYNLVLFF